MDKLYIVRSERNPKMILCTDGEFHAESIVGIGGFSAKTFKLESNAKTSCHDKKVIVEPVQG